jgi:hypothetical protein
MMIIDYFSNREKRRLDEIKELDTINRVVDGGWRKTLRAHSKFDDWSDEDDDAYPLSRRRRLQTKGKFK